MHNNDPHPRLTDDPERNAALITEYDASDDTAALYARMRGLGYRPPQRYRVATWGLCVVTDDDGHEWLAWDAETLEPET